MGVSQQAFYSWKKRFAVGGGEKGCQLGGRLRSQVWGYILCTLCPRGRSRSLAILSAVLWANPAIASPPGRALSLVMQFRRRAPGVYPLPETEFGHRALDVSTYLLHFAFRFVGFRILSLALLIVSDRSLLSAGLLRR
jgi:hypothetical protein